MKTLQRLKRQLLIQQAYLSIARSKLFMEKSDGNDQKTHKKRADHSALFFK